ncbi:MAG: DASH family cryptochrome [Bacteroidia bacterium]|nr:DASH family cryptochrome [Bacteroidia bacterium]
MKWERGILWFRNDLRLHDNEALTKAIENVGKIIPVYILDERQLKKSPFGFPKIGPHRAQFLLDSVRVLKKRLQEKGSDLIFRIGKPEELIPKLSEEYAAKGVFAHCEVTYEETNVEEALENALFKNGVSLEMYWGASLYHLADLPMPVRSLPDIFTQFRKEVEKFSKVRPTFGTPDNIRSPFIENPGEIPALEDLGLEAPKRDSRSVLKFGGGEIEALDRLNTYFWEEDRLKEYKETRNGLVGGGYSSKFSPWLALGCISPRKIYEEVKRYEKVRKKNSSTYWLVFELIWRDYFRFVAKQHGNTLFLKGGVKGEISNWDDDMARFELWANGETGIPFIDANMRELKLTGFMSNRGRQNVASFLVKDLNLDWRMGAEWFEYMLIDYDVCSNWGNWNYVAGIGNDPRENRYFNILSQASRYDGKGEYVKLWIPELGNLPVSMVHTPYLSYRKELMKFDVELGRDYPHPLIKLGAGKNEARKFAHRK